MMPSWKNRLAVVLLIAAVSTIAGSVAAQAPMPHRGTPTKGAAPPAPIRISMEDLHAQGGVPRGWKFLVPPGDAGAGRRVFVAMECFACHEVKGENFPQPAKTPHSTGPVLTGMGAHHPAEYFAESIMNPNRVIVKGPGYTGPDGLSTMPSYAESMTLGQLVDVVTYLRSLGGGEAGHADDPMSGSGATHRSMKMN